MHLRRALELFEADDDGSPSEMEPHATVVLRLADLCDLVGSYEEATLLYRSLLDGPLGPRATCGLSASVRNRGEYDDALAILDAASAHDVSKQEEAALWLERGRALMVAKGFDAAIDAFTSGLARRADRQPGSGRAPVRPRARESSVGRVDDALTHALEARARSRPATTCETSRARCACSVASTKISAGSTTRPMR